MSQSAVIYLTGAGAAKNLELGFVPDACYLINTSDSPLSELWFSAQGAGTYISSYNTEDVEHGSTVDANNPTASDGVKVEGFQGITITATMMATGKVVKGWAIKADRVRTS